MTAKKIGLGFLLLVMAAIFGLMIYGAIQTVSQPAPTAAASANRASKVPTLTRPAPRIQATVQPAKGQATQAAAQGSQAAWASSIPEWVVWVVLIVVGLLLLWLLGWIVKTFVQSIWKQKISTFRKILKIFLWIVLVLALIPALFLPEDERNSVFGLVIGGYWVLRFVRWLFKQVFGRKRRVSCSRCGGRGYIFFLAPHSSGDMTCSSCNGTGYVEVADMTVPGWILLLLGIAGIIWGIAGGGFFLGLIGFFIFMGGLITIINNRS